jgi:transposase
VGYHHKAALGIPNDITSIALPPYASELDPIETVWQHLRQNVLSYRILDDDEQIVDACADTWNARVALPERQRSITRRSRATAVKR